jgi:hypothetical protein
VVHREQEEVTVARGENSLSRAKTASLAAYKGGVVSLIEVLDADRRLQETRDARAQAQTQIARAAIASSRPSAADGATGPKQWLSPRLECNRIQIDQTHAFPNVIVSPPRRTKPRREALLVDARPDVVTPHAHGWAFDPNWHGRLKQAELRCLERGCGSR